MAERLARGDIGVGTALPWPVYDANGKLLLREGYIISSERQLERLLAGGLYRRNAQPSAATLVRDKAERHQATPFTRLEEAVLRLGRLLDSAMINPPTDFAARIEKIAAVIQLVSEKHTDAALGFAQLFHDAPYTHYHPLRVAILSQPVAQALALDARRQRSLIAACLTSNIAMVELQNVLQVQVEPVTPEQRADIQAHPARSTKLLASLGVTDKQWLLAVWRHHERMDGSGYPNALSGEAIPMTARILAVCDRFAASTAERGYKRSLAPMQALQSAFQEQQQQDEAGEYDPTVLATLIQTAGVFPPGSMVRLANGERGIVTRRNGRNSTEPTVAALESAEGKSYSIALRRDTSEREYRIVQSEPLEHPLRLPLDYVWGYRGQ